MQRSQALASMNQTLFKTKRNSFDGQHSRYQSVDFDGGKDDAGSCPSASDVGRALSHGSSSGSLVMDDNSWTSDQASTLDCSSSESQVHQHYDQQCQHYDKQCINYKYFGVNLYGQINVNFELEKLRIELRHVKGIYAMAQSETNDASRKVIPVLFLRPKIVLLSFTFPSVSAGSEISDFPRTKKLFFSPLPWPFAKGLTRSLPFVS